MSLHFIKEIIAEHVGYEEAEEVALDLSISDDLDMSTEDLQGIIESIEDEFGIEIPEEAMPTVLPPASVISVAGAVPPGKPRPSKYSLTRLMMIKPFRIPTNPPNILPCQVGK